MEQADYDFLREQALANPGDLDLPEDERRTRPDEIDPGSEFSRGGVVVTVLCPGRGAGQVCVGWVDGDGRSVAQAAITDLLPVDDSAPVAVPESPAPVAPPVSDALIQGLVTVLNSMTIEQRAVLVAALNSQQAA